MAENTSQNHTVNYMSQNLAVGIADDSVSKIEPSMLKQDIVDGSPRIKGHSTVDPHITEEKMFRTWTFDNCGRKSWKVQGYRHRIPQNQILVIFTWPAKTQKTASQVPVAGGGTPGQVNVTRTSYCLCLHDT